MTPKLILLNGNPGMGKSTLAHRYVSERPLAMNLDTDRIRDMFGQWQAARPVSEDLKQEYVCVLAGMHLQRGFDVIIPNLIETIGEYERYEQVAQAAGAILKELVLVSNVEDAIERCKIRGRAHGYADGFRPGGVLDTSGRERKLESMYENMLATVALRPNVTYIYSIFGREGETYARCVRAIEEVNN